MGSDDRSAAALAELTERLQRLRLEKRLSVTSLETRAGLGHTTVSQALNGSVPSEATVIALARALRVDPEPLLALRSQAAGAMEQAGPAHPASQGLPIPQQLPAGASVFVGREDDLAALDAMLAGVETGGAVVISAISGGAGVGKTRLAVQWAHRIKGRFPDGVLFVNLQGYDPAEPISPGEALDGFLRALDVPAAKIPLEVPARAALFRSVLAGRRILVVADNAATADQVRPLLPGTPGCLALITSRSRLSGLTTREGARRLSLDVLPEDEALRLLGEVIGVGRVAAQADAARTLAEQCACLPLALRIAADRVAALPHLRLADLVGELDDERDRLDVLAVGDDETTAMRAVFSWSYTRLPDPAARAFRLLGLHPAPDISLRAAAALLDLPAAGTRGVLDVLINQHLLEQSGPRRYRFHDLLRAYAAERAEREETGDTRTAASTRTLTWYLYTADAAYRTIHPNAYPLPLDEETPADAGRFTGFDQALAWLEEEKTSLVAAVRQAGALGHDDMAWMLTQTLHLFLSRRWYWDELRIVLDIGHAAATRLNNGHAQALMRGNQGEQLVWSGEYHRALGVFEEALSLAVRAGDRRIEGYVLTDIGWVSNELGRHDVGVERLRQALRVCREIHDRRCEGIALRFLAEAYTGLGQPDKALGYGWQAVTILQESGNPDSRARALCTLGEALSKLRQFDDAVGCYEEALRLLHGTGYRRTTGIPLAGLGKIYLARGLLRQAQQYLEEALSIFTDLNHAQKAAEISAGLATLGRPEEASPDTAP